MTIRDENGDLQITASINTKVNNCHLKSDDKCLGRSGYQSASYYDENSIEKVEAEANADLWAESINVTNETGLTPRELKDRVDKYEKALAELATLGNGNQLGTSDGNTRAQQALGISRNDPKLAYYILTIAKAKGEN